MPEEATCQTDEGKHFYGGQAVIEGVMMRGTDRYAVAVRRADGEVVLGEKTIESFSDRHPWAKWPLIRGNVAMIDGLILGFAGLQFSADVLAQEEQVRLAEEARAQAPQQPSGSAADATEPDTAQEEPAGLGPLLMGLTAALGTAIAIGLFVLLPTWLVGLLMQKPAEGGTYGQDVVRNVVEGGVRLLVLVLYVLGISMMQYVRRVFQNHGAEHATINCYESGEPVTVANCLRYSALHPRCGTAFLLVVIVVKIILGCFFGWPVLWLRMLIRLALLPIVAGIAYEIIRWAGRHRDSAFSRFLAAPGMLMQLLTTRRPDAQQIEVAIQALSAVAPEVSLPDGITPARKLPLPLQAQPAEQPPVAPDGQTES